MAYHSESDITTAISVCVLNLTSIVGNKCGPDLAYQSYIVLCSRGVRMYIYRVCHSDNRQHDAAVIIRFSTLYSWKYVSVVACFYTGYCVNVLLLCLCVAIGSVTVENMLLLSRYVFKQSVKYWSGVVPTYRMLCPLGPRVNIFRLCHSDRRQHAAAVIVRVYNLLWQFVVLFILYGVHLLLLWPYLTFVTVKVRNLQQQSLLSEYVFLNLTRILSNLE